MSDIQSESQHERKGSEHGGIGRRRLLRAGLAAAPVVLAVSGRSAMAATCPDGLGLSQATFLSVCPHGDWIGSSHHTLTSGRLGLSPDDWKPKPEGQTFQPPYPWPIAPFETITTPERQTDSFEHGLFGLKKTEGKSDRTEGTTYTWNPKEYLQYRGIPQNAGCWDTGTKYNAIFSGASETRSFSRILLDDNGSLAWHFCAAYLNAAAMPAGTYVMTTEEVIFLERNGTVVPGGNSLTSEQIKAFLKQTWA